MKYEIDKGIPVPPRKAGGQPRSHPLYDMEVGDSYFVPWDPQKDMGKQRRSIANGAWRVSNQIGVRCTVRQVEGGIRVWRVE